MIQIFTGKGMHDGAGAWLKSAVARACLAGVGIQSVEEFFQYCIQFLATNATKSNFTSERNFYLISQQTAAMYRATMPASVKGSTRIKQTKHDKAGWFFWATTDEPGVLVQRRCPIARALVASASTLIQTSQGAHSRLRTPHLGSGGMSHSHW